MCIYIVCRTEDSLNRYVLTMPHQCPHPVVSQRRMLSTFAVLLMQILVVMLR
jgi:hypothetical protein